MSSTMIHSFVLNESSIAALIAIGFGEAIVRRGLQRFNNDADRTAEWLFTQPITPAPPAMIMSSARVTVPSSAVRDVSPPSAHRDIIVAQHQHAVRPTVVHYHPPPHHQVQHQYERNSPVKQYAASASSSSVTVVRASSAGPADGIALPEAWYRGVVYHFRIDPSMSGDHDKAFGFIRSVDDRLDESNIYFKWDNVLSFNQSLSPIAHLASGARSHLVTKAMDLPDAEYLCKGDIVAFRTIQVANLKVKGETCTNAVDVKVLTYAKGNRRAVASHGARVDIAPHSASMANMLALCIPSQHVSSFIGRRMKGIIQRVATQRDGGLITVHHANHPTIACSLSAFKRQYQSSSSSSSSSMGAAASMMTVHIGDVVEFMLSSDPCDDASSMLIGTDIVIVPTSKYVDIDAERRLVRVQDNLEIEAGLVTRDSILPSIFIQSDNILRDECRWLEFKSLTRSASAHGQAYNMMKKAEQYLCSFLNSDGGTILFGIEDNGLIVGLPMSSADRDTFRKSIDGMMKKFLPIVHPRLYSIRFIPVTRLYKSSWMRPDGSGSKGASMQLELDDMVASMMKADGNDRVEMIKPELWIVSVSILKGSPTVPYYETSSRECFERQDGSSPVMTEAMKAQTAMDHKSRMDETNRKEESDMVQALHNSSIDELKQKLKVVEQSHNDVYSAMLASVAAPQPASSSPIVAPIAAAMQSAAPVLKICDANMSVKIALRSVALPSVAVAATVTIARPSSSSSSSSSSSHSADDMFLEHYLSLSMIRHFDSMSFTRSMILPAVRWLASVEPNALDGMKYAYGAHTDRIRDATMTNIVIDAIYEVPSPEARSVLRPVQ